jgi:hypothetical protein
MAWMPSPNPCRHQDAWWENLVKLIPNCHVFGINLAELIDKLEMIEALTLIGMTEPRSTSHQRGSDERLSLN